MSNRDDVDTVRSRTDILQVVAPYVALKRSGKIWKGLCPFHNEKTPSFQVNADRGLWRCFGQCSDGGDVFKFLQKVDNLTFPEALERLALKAGVTLTRDVAFSRNSVLVGEKDRLYAALAATARYYELSLRSNREVLDYLSGRGILPQTIIDYQIGFAGGDWDALPNYLDVEGISRDDAVRAGVLVAKDRGGHYDKLHGRVVFPIVDVQERTIAFGGRLTATDPERPKYLNSAETPLFSKSKTLYGIAKARKAITDLGEAIVVEGYLDVITCHQSGFMNVIATLGTSLTEEHALIIKRLAGRVLLAFDSDTAGVKAAQRAKTIFEALEVEVRILDMPKGEDPDSLINSGRSEDFKASIEGALPVNEYRLKQILSANDPNLSELGRTTLFQREILPILRATRSVIERERYIRLCAPIHPFYSSGSAMAEEQIRQEVDGRMGSQPQSSRSYSSSARTGYRQSESREYPRDFKRTVGLRQPSIPVLRSLETAEDTIIQALLDPKLEHYDLLVSLLKPDVIVRPLHVKLVRCLLDRPGSAGVHAALEDPELSADPAINEMLLGLREPIPGVTEEVLRSDIKRLVRHAEDLTLAKLRELSRAGNVQANELYTKIMRERKGAVVEQKVNA